MTFNRLSLVALTLCLGLTAGCSSVLTATRDTPIEDDRGTRTFGYVVGVRKQGAHRGSHFSVADLYDVIDVPGHHGQGFGVGHTAGHAVGQLGGDGRLDHAACGQ